MGVRHAREYSDILQELTEAVGLIEDCYLFFEMEESEWKALQPDEQYEVLEALADDVFYGLGEHQEITVGNGQVTYRPQLHRIDVFAGDTEHRSISLI
ncbi:hypothetical protein ACFP56_20260 [Paenibacillus septentrionalis]|uniref:Uncharacterized protein n=1 Tax=Paenibacillus septentrionalis TaxID=429342 RepID=A0ABW1V866_9BACL